MKRKRMAVVLTALVAALGIVLGVAGPAAASELDYAERTDLVWDPTEVYWSYYVDGGFQGNGDLLWVRDNRSNGYPVSITWRDLDGDRSGTCLNKLGLAAGWVVCNKNFPEDHLISWAVGWQTAADGWQHSSWRVTRA